MTVCPKQRTNTGIFHFWQAKNTSIQRQNSERQIVLAADYLAEIIGVAA